MALIKVPGSMLAPDVAGTIPYTQGGVGAVERTVAARLRDAVSVKDFGAVGDGVTDDTAAFAAAMLNAKTDRKLLVYVPSGIYVLSTLVIPSGVCIVGDGHGSFGLGNQFGSDYVGTVIKQKAGATGPFVTFDTLRENATNDLIGPLHIEKLSVVGNGEATSGDGIRFQSADMAALGVTNASATRKTRLQAITTMRDVLVRNFSGHGIWMPNCHVGITVQNVYSGFNGGYGIFFDVSTGLLDGLSVRDFYGDANLLGQIGVYGMGSTFNPSDIKDHTVTFENITAEMRANTQAFAAGATGNKNCIVFDTCDSGTVIVRNTKHYSVVSGDKPEDTIVIKNQTAGYSPTIIGESVVNTIKPSQGQDVSGDTLGAILNDQVNSKTVPANIGKFIYGFQYAQIGVDGPAPSAMNRPYFIGGGYVVPNMSVPTGGLIASGGAPAVVNFETDAGANAKVWAWIASGGSYTLRTIDDAGTADIALTVSRTGGVASEFVFAKAIKFVNSALSATGIPTYADEAAAATAGLAAGSIYKTATGEVRIKL